MNIKKINFNKNQIIAVGIFFILVILVLVFYEVNSGPTIIYNEDVKLSEEKLQEINQEIEEVEEKLENQGLELERRVGLYVTLGQKYWELGEYKKASASLDTAVELNSTNEMVWYWMFKIQKTMQDYESARVSINNAITYEKSNPYFWLEYIDFAKNHLELTPDALEDFYTEAFFSTDFHIDIVTNFARYLEEQDKYAKALNYWRIAKESNPDNTAAYDAEIERLQEILDRLYPES